MARLVHLGGAVMDYVYRVPALPESGADVTAQTFARLPGGAVNMMVASRRTGLATACGGYLGTGPDGDALGAFLAGEGIDVLLPRYEAMDSGNSVVLITPDAERSFVSWPGAEAQADNLDALAPLLRSGDVIAVSGYVLLSPGCGEAVVTLIENLDEGISVVFDPAPVIDDVPPSVLATILARATWVSANQRELSILGGGGAMPEVALRLLSGRMGRAEGIVIRAGAAGAHLVEASGNTAEIAGFPVDAVDTNGAGDTHTGAFISALARGLSSRDAVRYANAAAAISVTRHGGPMAPGHHEIEGFLSLRTSGLAQNQGNVGC